MSRGKRFPVSIIAVRPYISLTFVIFFKLVSGNEYLQRADAEKLREIFDKVCKTVEYVIMLVFCPTECAPYYVTPF